MGAKVVHFEVSGKDHKALQEFYGKMFDWSVDANNPMEYGMVTPDDAGIGGGVSPLPPDGSSHVTFYVEVDDLQSALDTAKTLGGQVASEPMEVPGGPTIAHFTDPAGNFIGLLKSGSMA